MRNILIDNLQILKKWSLKNETDLQKIAEKIKQQEQKIKDLKIETNKEKNDLDFLESIYQFKSDLSPNIEFNNDDFDKSFKKAEKIESDIGNVKNKSEKVDLKIDNLSNASLPQGEKDKLFVELEKDILNLKSAVEKLRDENQNLKKELELIIEKNKIESQKIGLEKENSNLKDKLEALKDKTQNSKNEFQEKTKNKITYSDSKEAQKINEKER